MVSFRDPMGVVSMVNGWIMMNLSAQPSGNISRSRYMSRPFPLSFL